MWKYEPMDRQELNELLQLYNEINGLDDASGSEYDFSFNIKSNGEYNVKSKRKLLDSKLIL